MSGISGPSIIKSGLVLALDAGNKNSYVSGSKNIFDLSGTSVTGSLKNGVGYSATNIGNLVFDGTNDYISTSFSTSNLSTSSNYTLMCWVYLDATGGPQTLLYLGNYLVYTPNYNWIGLSKNGTTLTAANYINPTDNSLSITYPSAGWYQFAQVRNSTTHYAYLNGVQKTSGTYATTSINASSTLRIGNTLSNNDYLNGKIASIQLYNRALSDSEVLQNYNATKARFGL